MKNTLTLISSLSICFIFSTPALAAEADYFTDRDKAIEVSGLLDQKMQNALMRAAATLNSKNKKPTAAPITENCDRDELITSIRDTLGRVNSSYRVSVKPAIGNWSLDKTLGAIKLPINKTIYHGIERGMVRVDQNELGQFQVQMEKELEDRNRGLWARIKSQGKDALDNSLVSISAQGRPFQSATGLENCCDGIMKYNNVVISSDKLEHFLQVGLDAYLFSEETKVQKELFSRIFFSHIEKKLNSQKMIFKQEQTAHLFNHITEEGVFGTLTTGVYSYADKAANFEGYRFWKNLTEDVDGKGAYFKCMAGGNWLPTERGLKFTFADYITDAWDEAINCSQYRYEWKAIADKNIETVMKKNQENNSRYQTACPILPERCKELKKRYDVKVEGTNSSRAEQVLHSLCRDS